MKRIAATLILGIAFSLVVGWYLRPVLVWHFTVEPTLEAHANATRLHAKTLTDFETPSIDWPRITVANFSIHAPISSGESKGVATIKAVGDRIRLVIYAYSLDGMPTRLIGLTGTRIDLLYRALGSLEVHAATSGAGRSRCR